MKSIQLLTALAKCSLLTLLCFALTHSTAAQTVPANVTVTSYSSSLVEATNSITIGPGFTVTAGNSFNGRIRSDLYATEQIQAQNYIKTEELFIPLTTTIAVANAKVAEKTIAYQYFDGLGRAIQNVGVKETPQAKDMVAPMEYDIYGRQPKQYLPYPAIPADGTLKPSAIADQSSFYSVSNGSFNAKVKTDASPFSLSIFETSSLDRPLQTGSGSAWQPDGNNFNGTGNKATKYAYLSNTDGTGANQERIIIWTIVSGLPFNAGFYPSNALSLSIVYDEENKQVRQYTNSEGQVVLKKVQAVSGLPATNLDADWAFTYYVYDDNDRLRFVLPPEFITRVSGSISSSLVNTWCFQYGYDSRNRMISKRVPGADPMEMVYDKWDRLILTRDGNQTNAGKWLFTKYDAVNRPIMTGEFVSSSSQVTLQAAVNSYYSTNPNNRFESPTTGTIGYTTNVTYPNSISLTDLFTISYFDDYTFKTKLGLGTAYDFTTVAGFSGTANYRTKGKPTGSKIRILGTTNWLISVMYYDGRFRVLQSVGDDHLGNKNRITNEYYGITGWITKSKQEHGSALTRLSETEYDHRGRVLRVYATLDGSTRTLMASNTYNEIGQLVEKNLHSTDGGSSFLQSNDYRYNVRGWLTHINNSQLSNDGVYNNDNNDLYGMQLLYNDAAESVNGANSVPQFNGNIAAMKWTTNNMVDPTKEKVYAFDYDAMNRLTGSRYASRNGGAWSADGGNFDESLTYDKVGNIKTLNRYGWFAGSKQQIDQLTYEYKGGGHNSNQLVTVTDNSAHYQWGKADAGFVESTHSPGVTEMDYDYNGNPKIDLNKNITAITYNHLNLPAVITISGGKTITYTYDASGSKLKYKAVDNGTVVKETDYVGGVQYENGQIAFVMTGEGRAMKRGSNIWDYEYHLKDHLGNTRVAFGNLQDVDSYTATMETERATSEESAFKNIANRRDATWNHTAPPNAEVPAPSKGAWLNGSVGREVGPGKFLNVTAGDKIKMEVYVRYVAGSGNNADVVASLVSAVTTSFNATAGENAAAYGGFNSYLPGLVNGMSYNSGQPKAYLNYILFNSSYASPQFGYQVLSVTAASGWEKLSIEVTATSTGYGYIYVTNESNYNVYFDDLKIVHERSSSGLKVVQAQDYYPFGLAFNTYQKENPFKNGYLYNKGTELASDFGLNWYQTPQRFYAPELGRFWGIDAMADLFPSVNPMQFSYNNPLAFNDPTGLEPVPGCEECGDVDKALPELVFSGEEQQKDFSWISSLSSSSNPIERAIGRKYEKEGLNAAAHYWADNRSIHFGKQASQSKWIKDFNNVFGKAATYGVGGMMVVSVAAPYITISPSTVSAISSAGSALKTALTSQLAAYKLESFVTNAATELVAQGLSNGPIDIWDVASSGLFGFNTYLSAVSNSLVDVNLNGVQTVFDKGATSIPDLVGGVGAAIIGEKLIDSRGLGVGTENVLKLGVDYSINFLNNRVSQTIEINNRDASKN